MQIEDKVYDMRIPVPGELLSEMMDIYDFAVARSQKSLVSSCRSDYWAECDLARRISKQLHVQVRAKQ